MRSLVVASVVAVACLAGTDFASAQDVAARVSAAEPSARPIQRARTRIEVHPLPTQRSVRRCEFHLAQEVWPNGSTYIVPREHCWWAPR
jgi:hypothetical protein